MHKHQKAICSDVKNNKIVILVYKFAFLVLVLLNELRLYVSTAVGYLKVVNVNGCLLGLLRGHTGEYMCATLMYITIHASNTNVNTLYRDLGYRFSVELHNTVCCSGSSD